MKTAEFNKIVNNRLKMIKKIFISKAKEYAREDRLHNFKVAARISGLTPEQALQGMMMKHLVSVMDLISDTNLSKYPWSNDIINEKLGDSINYLILLEALLKERVSNA